MTIERTGPKEGKERLATTFPVRYAVIQMCTTGRKRTPMSAGTVTTAGIPSNIVTFKTAKAFYYTLYMRRFQGRITGALSE